MSKVTLCIFLIFRGHRTFKELSESSPQNKPSLFEIFAYLKADHFQFPNSRRPTIDRDFRSRGGQ